MIEHQFGKYTVVRRLGAGGMAEVFLCKLQGIAGFEKQLVVKRIRPDIASDADFLTMFFDEARLAANLNHPNIIQTFEVDQISGMPFIAMEYVNGATLSAVLKKHREEHRKTNHGYVAHVFAGVCAGLDYAHNALDSGGRRLEIVHRDISPQNIIVSLEGTAKIFDFGVAKARGSLALTSANHIKGKFAYMAPEQLKALPIDAKADVYAVGICLYEATTGRRPFSGVTEAELFAARLDGSFKKPSELMHRFPAELEEIILDAMEADPRARPSARELHERLSAFCSNGIFAATASTVSAWMRDMFAQDSSAYDVYQSNTPSPGMPQGSNLPQSNVPVGAHAHIPHASTSLTPRSGSMRRPSTHSIFSNMPPSANAVEASPGRNPMNLLIGALIASTIAVLALVAYRLIDRPHGPAVATASPPPVAPRSPAQQQAPEPQPAPAQPQQVAPEPAPLPAAAVPVATAEADETYETAQEPATATVARTVEPKRAPAKPQKVVTKAPPQVRVTKAPTRVAVAESVGSGSAIGSGGRMGSGSGSSASSGSGSAGSGAFGSGSAGSGSAGSGSAFTTTTHTVTQPTGSATTTITITSQAPQKIMVNKAAPAAIANVGSLDAIPSVGNINVDGSLTTSEVQSALGRTLDALRGCYRSAATSSKKTPDLSVKLTFEIDEGARASRVRVAGDTLGLGSCVKDAIGAVRTRVAPDVGTVSVTATVRFKPTR